MATTHAGDGKQVLYGVSPLTDHDVYLFRQGRHSRLYEKLGAHVMSVKNVTGVHFAVWAPNARAVSVIGDFNGWRPGSHSLHSRKDGCGIWEGFIPGVVAMREFLHGGSLGRPLQVAVAAGQHFPTFRPAYREIYYTRHETGGGAIQDALTHLANSVEWLVGPTARLFCEAAHQALEGVAVEDTVCVTARNGEVQVSYALNQFQAPNEVTIQVHCEDGSVRYEGHEQRWSVFRRGESSWTHHAAQVADRDDLFVAQAHAFLDGLEGKPTALCTIDEAVQTLKFNLAALESARTGKAIYIVA